MIQKGKVTIIGAGLVGSTTAFAIMQSSVVTEIVLIDVNKDKAEGDVLDMSDGLPFMKPTGMKAGDYSDAEGSELIIITAGANQKPDETRLDLLKKNAAIFKSITDSLKPYLCKESLILVVTNPVDILTYLTIRYTGLPANQVFGSGTVLDTARFRYMISEDTNIDPRNVHSYVIGEHGDSEVALWSTANIGGLPMEEYCAQCKNCSGQNKEEIAKAVRDAAYKIIDKKGATFYAVALAVKRIVECVLRDEHSILTISSLMNGEYGIEDVCISVPAVLAGNGVGRKLVLNLDDKELTALRESAATLKDSMKQLD